MTIEKYKRYISNLEDLLIKEQERGKKEDIAFYEWMLDVVKTELCLKEEGWRNLLDSSQCSFEYDMDTDKYIFRVNGSSLFPNDCLMKEKVLGIYVVYSV